MNSVSNIKVAQNTPVAFRATQPQMYATAPQEQPNEEKSKKLKKTLICLGAAAAAGIGIAIALKTHNKNAAEKIKQTAQETAQSSTRADEIKNLIKNENPIVRSDGLLADANGIKAGQRACADVARKAVGEQAESAKRIFSGISTDRLDTSKFTDITKELKPKGLSEGVKIIKDNATGATAMMKGTDIFTVKVPNEGAINKFVYDGNNVAKLSNYSSGDGIKKYAARIQSDGKIFGGVESKGALAFDGSDITKFDTMLKFEQTPLEGAFGKLSQYAANYEKGKKIGNLDVLYNYDGDKVSSIYSNIQAPKGKMDVNNLTNINSSTNDIAHKGYTYKTGSGTEDTYREVQWDKKNKNYNISNFRIESNVQGDRTLV